MSARNKDHDNVWPDCDNDPRKEYAACIPEEALYATHPPPMRATGLDIIVSRHLSRVGRAKLARYV
jgi:hypothetical protein